jgi:hypothetical protein
MPHEGMSTEGYEEVVTAHGKKGFVRKAFVVGEIKVVSSDRSKTEWEMMKKMQRVEEHANARAWEREAAAAVEMEAKKVLVVKVATPCEDANIRNLMRDMEELQTRIQGGIAGNRVLSLRRVLAEKLVVGRFETAPKSFEGMLVSKYWKEWIKAVKAEVHTMREYDALTECWRGEARRERRTVAPCIEVNVYKWLPSGDYEKAKHRICYGGTIQKKHRDFDKTFAPTVSMDSIRLFMAMQVTAPIGHEAESLDIKSAFLTAKIDKLQYMETPSYWEHVDKSEAELEVMREDLLRRIRDEGYKPKKGRKKERLNSDTVLRLNAAVYGTRQAPNLFWKHIAGKLQKKCGMVQLKTDPGWYYIDNRDGHLNSKRGFEKVPRGRLDALLHVDDCLYGGSPEMKEWFREQLREDFELKELGICKNFTGVCIERGVLPDGRRYIRLQQTEYAKQVVHRFKEHLIGVKKDPGVPMSKALDGRDKVDDLDKEAKKRHEKRPYMEAVGCLMYLEMTRPDLMYAINSAACYMKGHGDVHWKAVY